MRVGQRLHFAKLSHQAFIDGDTAGGIEDQNIISLKLRRLKRPLGDLGR